MQSMNPYVKYVAVFVDQTNGLLRFSVYINGFQPRKHAHPVVDMGNVISFLQVVQLFKGQRLARLPEPFFQLKTVISFKNLMVGVTKQIQGGQNKPFVQGEMISD
mgnify:CR=1 FL=1